MASPSAAENPACSPLAKPNLEPAATGLASWLTATCVVFAAAIAMAATLPGRTHGLGIITTRLLADIPGLDATTFAYINLSATLLGALFCLPCGWLIDRFGSRPVMGGTMLCLVASVYAMSYSTGIWDLAILLTLTRGLGQSMLSVVSITIMGKWFRKDAGLPMGGYAVLLTVLMTIGTVLLMTRVADIDTPEGKLPGVSWRVAWSEMAIGVFIAGIIGTWLTVSPGDELARAESLSTDRVEEPVAASATLWQALATPCFWVFAGSISFFGMVASGVSLFQQLILAERQLPESVYHATLPIGLAVGLFANLFGGWLSRLAPMQLLLMVALILLGGSLAALPLLETPTHAYIQTVVSALGGGLLTVLFFSVWTHAYGPKNLGSIQAAAQMMTVVASAAGPAIVQTGRDHFGSYFPILTALASVAGLLAVAAVFTRVPSAVAGDWSASQPQIITPPLVPEVAAK